MTSSKKRISGKKNKSIYRFYLCTLLVLLAVFVSCAKKEVISSQKDDEGPFVIDCSTLVSIKNESKNTISGAIAIPSIVTWIDDYAFSDCTSLTAINIPSSVIYVGESVFKGCTGLSYISVDVENSKYTSNGKMLLSKDKTRLISYPSASGNVNDIPSSVTEICDGAFAGCTGLTSIIIPSSVKEIGSCAFSGCICLTSVSIPSSVHYIEEGAFEGCTSLTSISVNNYNSYYSSNGKILLSKDKTELISYPSAIGKVSDIPLSVTVICERAFSGCSGMISIDIPSSVEEIEDEAFFGCISLKDVNIADSVYCIGYGAFENCTALTSIEIPSSVEELGDRAFAGCKNLQSIIIPDSVDYIEYDVFKGCARLTDISVDPDNPHYCSNGKMLLTKDQTELVSYPSASGEIKDIPSSVVELNGSFSGCKTLTSVSIPSSVRIIGFEAFEDCISLKSIKIPSSVYRIDYRAFSGCTELSSISIPSSVTDLGDYTFDGCTNLKSVSIPSSVTTIGTAAFQNCISLKSIKIPSSVTEIGKGAFAGCVGLTSIKIPSSVNDIGSFAFYGCKNLTDITVDSQKSYYRSNGKMLLNWLGTILFSYPSASGDVNDIPSGVLVIEYAAFYGCTDITSVRIPDSVKEIRDVSFYGCTGMSSIVIPSSIEKIGYFAFEACTSLTEIVYEGSKLQFEQLMDEVKSKDSFMGVPAKVIHCSDGDIDLL